MASNARFALSLAVSSMATSCYSPNNMEVATNPSAGAETSGSSTDTASGPTSTQPSSDDSSTSATGPTTASTTDPTADSSATDAESDAGSDDSSSAGPVNPFCGDGTIDDGEDCDDGDANALTGACRPDCTNAECGDGDIWAGVEGCDDGVGDNVLEIGACAPDCSHVIEQRVITTGGLLDGGDFGKNPVAHMDGQCEPGYLAMFAYPDLREAALNNFDASESLDWVLHPYTAYVREDGTLLWITDSVPLLGVRDGQQQALVDSIEEPCEQCFALVSPTGMAPGWTTESADTCQLWTSSDAADSVLLGNPRSTTEFLRDLDFDNRTCDFPFWLHAPICVEQ